MLQTKLKQLFNTVKHLKQQIKRREKNTTGKIWMEPCWMIFLELLSMLATTTPILACV